MGEHAKAFEDVKKIIADFPIRAHFDAKLPTILETDASRLKGMGYVLMQLHKDGQNKLIEAGSRWLTPAEQNYGMTSLELSAVNWKSSSHIYLDFRILRLSRIIRLWCLC